MKAGSTLFQWAAFGGICGYGAGMALDAAVLPTVAVGCLLGLALSVIEMQRSPARIRLR